MVYTDYQRLELEKVSENCLSLIEYEGKVTLIRNLLETAALREFEILLNYRNERVSNNAMIFRNFWRTNSSPLIGRASSRCNWISLNGKSKFGCRTGQQLQYLSANPTWILLPIKSLSSRSPLPRMPRLSVINSNHLRVCMHSFERLEHISSWFRFYNNQMKNYD